MSLFKYMSVEAAVSFAKTLKIRFTQPFELNDPFEFRPMLNFVGTADYVRGTVEALTIDDAFSTWEKRLAGDPRATTVLKTLRRVIAENPGLQQQCMAALQRIKADVLDKFNIAPFWEAAWEKLRQELGQAVGILSLTEDPSSILMWSYYASQHFGLVVEFYENHPWFNQKRTPTDDLRCLVKVSYVENPHPRTWKQVNATAMLYTKTANWAHEREWRIIRPLKDGTEVSPGIFCFEVPAEAIRSITFGCRCSPALEAEICAAVNANAALAHVRFRRAKLGGDKIEIVDC